MAQAALNTGQNIGSAYTGTGTNIAALTGANPYGQAMENAAQAQASSYMGGASALSNALNSGMSNALAYNMMGNMYPQGPSGSYQFGGQNVPYFIK
jgi:hypothetical protein